MRQKSAVAAVGLCILAAVAFSNGDSGIDQVRSTGPDLIVSDLYETWYWGVSGDIRAYSVGTFACNVGDQPAVWYNDTDQHPVIGQNMFRLSNGRFEQIGQSWLKWGFYSENTDFCGSCQDPNSGDLLGVNCSDSYSATLNGYQAALGPKSVVNPFTGAFPPFPPTPPGTTIGGRLQVHTADLTVANAQYFVEGQYVSPDDSTAGNLHNNASYREVWVRPDYSLTFLGRQTQPSVVVPQQPAIAAWSASDPTVYLAAADIPGDGRVYAAHEASDLGGGLWHHELAIQNLNCDRAIAGVIVRLPIGASASNLGFHAVQYHSGEPYNGMPWTGAAQADGVHWDLVDVGANSNALRWGTLYNFWFDTDVPPTNVTLANLRLFKPGTPTSLDVRIGPEPALRGDTNCDGQVDFGDVNAFVTMLINPGDWPNQFPGCPLANGDINQDTVVDFGDINAFVDCVLAGGCP